VPAKNNADTVSQPGAAKEGNNISFSHNYSFTEANKPVQEKSDWAEGSISSTPKDAKKLS
jgi:hypothetical protein